MVLARKKKKKRKHADLDDIVKMESDQVSAPAVEIAGKEKHELSEKIMRKQTLECAAKTGRKRKRDMDDGGDEDVKVQTINTKVKWSPAVQKEILKLITRVDAMPQTKLKSTASSYSLYDTHENASDDSLPIQVLLRTRAFYVKGVTELPDAQQMMEIAKAKPYNINKQNGCQVSWRNDFDKAWFNAQLIAKWVME